LGIAATGAEVNITGTGMVRMENGKVTEVWDNWDKFAMFQQIESAVKARGASA
jgi:predicted ester cyclase